MAAMSKAAIFPTGKGSGWAWAGTRSLRHVSAPVWLRVICQAFCDTRIFFQPEPLLTRNLWVIFDHISLWDFLERTRQKFPCGGSRYAQHLKLVEVQMHCTVQRGDAVLGRSGATSQAVPACQTCPTSTTSPGLSCTHETWCFWAAYECVNHQCKSWAAEPVWRF